MPHDHAFFRFIRHRLCAVLLLMLPSWAASAPNPDQINRAIDQQRQALRETQQAQQALRQRLSATQLALQRTETERDDLADTRDRLAADRADLEARAEALDEKIRDQKQQIAEGLRLAYTLGNQSPIGALLDPGHALDDARFLHYMRQILAQTSEQIAALRVDQQAAVANQQALDESAKKLADAQTALDAALAQHRQAVAEQNRLLDQLSTQADAQSQALAALLAKKKTLDEEIRRLNAAAAQKAKDDAAAKAAARATDRAGDNADKASAAVRHPAQALSEEEVEARAPTAASLPAGQAGGGIPIAGKVLRPYGAEIANGDMRAQGISFAAPAGSPVRAVAAGRVIFADSMKGWGELVILKHPGGYLSLYANNSALAVRTGQQVAAGAVIARSGNLNGHESGLYFEVRRGNDTVNPARWAPYRQVRR